MAWRSLTTKADAYTRLQQLVTASASSFHRIAAIRHELAAGLVSVARQNSTTSTAASGVVGVDPHADLFFLRRARCNPLELPSLPADAVQVASLVLPSRAPDAATWATRFDLLPTVCMDFDSSTAPPISIKQLSKDMTRDELIVNDTLIKGASVSIQQMTGAVEQAIVDNCDASQLYDTPHALGQWLLHLLSRSVSGGSAYECVQEALICSSSATGHDSWALCKPERPPSPLQLVVHQSVAFLRATSLYTFFDASSDHSSLGQVTAEFMGSLSLRDNKRQGMLIFLKRVAR
ncbi:unnamed protein product [Vitrella brassicaformis CCMP3155]|uniref:Uncharacterized protein n=1 Tax=Vitrella brassicaformis (strain CCMP3155) TaxID=1169540 RepID=A0A0G4G8K5_VITBC|nr:unnamed protein product [Vitrella brassicaformis CCMP3155]|eukprot:CEM25135.1 unnamed protein product [Vitrella brassicaformis CCMP3155]